MTKQTSNKSVLILSGFNQRAVISFCRFAKENNIVFHIVARNQEDTILISIYKEYVIDIRKNNDLTLNDFEKWKLKINENWVVILPSTEYLNRFILRNRNILEINNYIIPLCESDLYDEISDKYSFDKLCNKYNIKIPAEYDNPIKYPCVAKPKNYFTINDLILKPVILYSIESYNEFRANYDSKNFYFQEFIQGKSIYLLFYFSLDGNVSVFSQENLIQQDQGSSIIAAVSSDYHLEDIALKYNKMFLELGFHGLVMIEIKLFNGQYYMIEANPRLWGPSQLILDSGMNLFDLFMADYGLLQFNKSNNVYRTGVVYYWSGGIFLDSKNKVKIVFHGDFNQEKYLQDYYKLFSSEIYLREDTINIFHYEHKL